MRQRRKEYRAKFSTSDGAEGFGPIQTSLLLALKDAHESTTGVRFFLTGVETREVEVWTPVPLDDIRAVK